MSVIDELVKNASDPQAEIEQYENNLNYFSAMGKAAAHGYFDGYNKLVNGMEADEAVAAVKEAADSIPDEVYKTAESLLEEK